MCFQLRYTEKTNTFLSFPTGSEIYRLQGKDPDGDQVFYSIKPENEELKVDAQTGRVILITTLVYNPVSLLGILFSFVSVFGILFAILVISHTVHNHSY